MDEWWLITCTNTAMCAIYRACKGHQLKWLPVTPAPLSQRPQPASSAQQCCKSAFSRPRTKPCTRVRTCSHTLSRAHALALQALVRAQPSRPPMHPCTPATRGSWQCPTHPRPAAGCRGVQGQQGGPPAGHSAVPAGAGAAAGPYPLGALGCCHAPGRLQHLLRVRDQAQAGLQVRPHDAAVPLRHHHRAAHGQAVADDVVVGHAG